MLNARHRAVDTDLYRHAVGAGGMQLQSKVRATSHPRAEWGGLIWIYKDPKEKQPQLPRYHFCIQPTNPDRRVHEWIRNPTG